MSDLEKKLDIDIIQFFTDIEAQSHNDKKKTLKLLFEKYLHLNTAEHVMDRHDLNSIIDLAGRKFATEKFPVHLDYERKRVEQDKLRHMCMVEATIVHLKNTECLKKLPKFDKREDKL
mgnify:CR=1 FL=1